MLVSLSTGNCALDTLAGCVISLFLLTLVVCVWDGPSVWKWWQNQRGAKR